MQSLIEKLEAWKEPEFHRDRQLADEVLIADGWKVERNSSFEGGFRWYWGVNPQYSSSEGQRLHPINDLNAALYVVPPKHSVCLVIHNGVTDATVWTPDAAHRGKSSKATIAILIAALKAKEALEQAKGAA